MNQNDKIIQITHKWFETFVLGLNLCPFARHPYKNDKVRFVVFEGDNLEKLTEMVVQEMDYLEKVSPSVCETTLVILRDCLTDFQEYLDYLEVAEYVLEQLELSLVFQVASFHPDYQFDETLPNDAENYTNRSPYPMLHILREDSVERAIEAYPEVGDIPAANIETMNELGTAKLKKMLYDITKTTE
jgi:uncharacterized protein